MLLRAFPGYTLRTLDRDYCKLLRLLEIERLGSRRADAGGGDEWQ